MDQKNFEKENILKAQLIVLFEFILIFILLTGIVTALYHFLKMPRIDNNPEIILSIQDHNTGLAILENKEISFVVDGVERGKYTLEQMESLMKVLRGETDATQNE